jgi:nanoRNase/pAp phosphatase (c-di-AMP/oligoRNAs hydrolase)
VSRAEVLDILRGADPVCVCAHASPDGDALGSLLGLGPSLAARGRDVVLYQDGDEPFPHELAFLGLERIARRVPADAARRTLIALDCGSALRIDRRGEVAGQFARVVNIDHHHDNTLFGAVNLGLRARPRSSRACWTRRASRWPRARRSRSTSAWSPTLDAFSTPTPPRARIGSQRGSCRRA